MSLRRGQGSGIPGQARDDGCGGVAVILVAEFSSRYRDRSRPVLLFQDRFGCLLEGRPWLRVVPTSIVAFAPARRLPRSVRTDPCRTSMRYSRPFAILCRSVRTRLVRNAPRPLIDTLALSGSALLSCAPKVSYCLIFSLNDLISTAEARQSRVIKCSASKLMAEHPRFAGDVRRRHTHQLILSSH